MSKIVTTTYKCNNCPKEESDRTKVLNWLVVTLMRDEILTQEGTGILKAVNQIKHRWDFCSKECLATWAMREKGRRNDP